MKYVKISIKPFPKTIVDHTVLTTHSQKYVDEYELS